MKPPFIHFSLKEIFFLLALLNVLPAFSQKNKFKNDSIAVRDSIREFMFQGALLSMDALQAKYESQKSADSAVKHQKAGESQNLFFQSRKYYRKALTFNSNYFPAWNNIGTTYYLQELPKAAIPCYRHALLINDDYSPAWYNLGKAYDVIGMEDSADYSFKQCIRSDSSYIQAYQDLSRIIMENGKDSSSALNYLRLAAKYKPTSDVPWVSMSVIYFSFKDSANAILALENAARIYPSDVDRLQMLSNYFANHNDQKKADFYLKLFAMEKKKQEIPKDSDPDK